MPKMQILVGFEESQAVCSAFLKRGRWVFSNDLLECSGDYPERHLQMDFFDALSRGEWDLVISFPPCTDLAVSGAHRFAQKRADGRQEKSIRLFFETWKVSNCVENPIGILNGGGKYVKQWFPDLYQEMLDAGFPFKPTQIIQPWQFGHDASKATCLWLRDLPPLVPTKILTPERFTASGRPLWGNQTPSGQNKLGPGPERAKLRSKTYPGIAEAMALQWG